MDRISRRPLVALAAGVLVAAQLLVAPSPVSLAEGSKDDKVAARKKIDEQLEGLKIELDDVNAELRQTYLDLADTELQIPIAQKDLEDARTEQRKAEEEDRKVGERLSAAQEEEKRLSGQVDRGREEVSRSDDELAQVALDAYKGGTQPNPASVFMGSQSPQDTVDRAVNYRLTMSSQGARLDDLRTDQSVNENSADRLTAVREEITRLKGEAEKTLKKKKEATSAAEKAKTDLDTLYSKQKTQRDTLEKTKRKYEGEQTTLEDQGNTLDTEIDKLAREEKARANRADGSVSASVPKGAWVRPVPGRISSPFGWRIHPVYHYRKFHKGVDFPVACGTPVGAAHAGRVIARTSNSAAGNKIILSHGVQNGKLITTSYHHLQGFAKPVGASVAAGETVGYVGTTGASTGCHLHFEVHEDGMNVNPQNYV